MVLTIVVFLIILSILVLVHEFGHFIVGKLAGVGVEEFALGLPFTKPLWSKKLKDGMKVSLYPVLFGGFVKLLGEENENKSVTQSHSHQIKGHFFYKINVWKRIAVVLAGVTMNLILAVAVFYFFLAISGFKVLVPRLTDYNFKSPSETAIMVTAVTKDSPAYKNGLKFEDILLSVDGKKPSTLANFQQYVKSRAGQPVSLEVSNIYLDNSRIAIITPRQNPPIGEGALGVGINEAIVLRYTSSIDKIFSGINYASDMFIYNLKVIESLISQSVETKQAAPIAEAVSGPVGIADVINEILKESPLVAFKNLVNLLGLLSISLAFINVLPFPALDGGRLVFLLIEALTTKKLAPKYENWINQAGMVILLIFIVLVSFSDVSKIIMPWLR